MGSSLSQKLITAGLSMAVGFVAGKAAVSAAIAAVAQRGVVNRTNKWFAPVEGVAQVLDQIQNPAIEA